MSRLYMRIRMEMLVEKILLKDLKPEEYVKVATIIVRPASQTAKDVTAALTAAEGYYDRLKKGEAWESVLNASTADNNVRQSNGLLGWRAMGAFPEPVKAEFATLKNNQFAKPVQTPNGIQIFRLLAKGAIASKQDITELRNEYLKGTAPQYMANLQKEAKIERFLP